MSATSDCGRRDASSRRCLRRRMHTARKAISAASATPPRAAPIPIPAFAPVLRPDAGVVVAEAVGEAEVCDAAAAPPSELDVDEDVDVDVVLDVKVVLLEVEVGVLEEVLVGVEECDEVLVGVVCVEVVVGVVDVGTVFTKYPGKTLSDPPDAAGSRTSFGITLGAMKATRSLGASSGQ